MISASRDFEFDVLIGLCISLLSTRGSSVVLLHHSKKLRSKGQHGLAKRISHRNQDALAFLPLSLGAYYSLKLLMGEKFQCQGQIIGVEEQLGQIFEFKDICILISTSTQQVSFRTNGKA